MTRGPEISLRGVDLSYAWKGYRRVIFQNFNLHIGAGDWLLVTGPSGCGKSALLRLIMGLQSPGGGEIWIGEKPIHKEGLNAAQEMGAVFLAQNHSQWLLGRTIKEELALWNNGETNINQIPPKLWAFQGRENQPIEALSCGERQLIFLAALFSRRPRLLLLDEPTSFLDQTRQELLHRTLEELNRKGITIVQTGLEEDVPHWGTSHLVLQASQLLVTE